jgi:hypothetical protein
MRMTSCLRHPPSAPAAWEKTAWPSLASGRTHKLELSDLSSCCWAEVGLGSKYPLG